MEKYNLENLILDNQQLINIATVFSASIDQLTGLNKRKIIDVTDLSTEEIAHIQQIVNDIRKKESSKKY